MARRLNQNLEILAVLGYIHGRAGRRHDAERVLDDLRERAAKQYVSPILGALIALVMGYALAEMAVMHPVAGSFGVFADRYLSRWSGFAVRATYARIDEPGLPRSTAGAPFALTEPSLIGCLRSPASLTLSPRGRG